MKNVQNGFGIGKLYYLYLLKFTAKTDDEIHFRNVLDVFR